MTHHRDYVQAADCVSGLCSFLDSGSPSEAYYYVTCETPEGEESSVSHPPPCYPHDFRINLQNNLYRVQWQNVMADMTGNPINVITYDIYMGMSSDFIPDVTDGSNRVGTTISNMFPHQPDPPGDYYVFKVMAVDEKGNSGPY